MRVLPLGLFPHLNFFAFLVGFFVPLLAVRLRFFSTLFFLVSDSSGLKYHDTNQAATHARTRQPKITAIITPGERIHSLPPVHAFQNSQVTASIAIGIIRIRKAGTMKEITIVKYVNNLPSRDSSPRRPALLSFNRRVNVERRLRDDLLRPTETQNQMKTPLAAMSTIATSHIGLPSRQ